MKNVTKKTSTNRFPLKGIPAVIWRFVAYTASIFVLLITLPELVESGNVLIFREGGPVEWLQFLLIGVSAALFCCGAALFSTHRSLLSFMAAFAIIAVFRELDSILDDLIPLLSWKLPAYFFAATCLFISWRFRGDFASQFRRFGCSRAFAILWIGFIIVVVLAQLMGHAHFLKKLMGADYVRDYKRVIEEICETFGYLLILIGCIETLLEVKAVNRFICWSAPSQLSLARPTVQATMQERSETGEGKPSQEPS